MSKKRFPENMAHVPARIEGRGAGTSDVEETERKRAKIQRVSVFRLRPHREQPGARHSSENVRELMESILVHGLLQPPLIAREPDGSMVILAGHRRVRACQLLVLDGKWADEKIAAFVRSDLTEDQILYMICAEAFHSEALSPVHEARMVGLSWLRRSRELGRDATIDDLADVLPPGRTSISESLTLFRALQDPRLGPLVRTADKAGKSLLVKALRATEFSTTIQALEAFRDGGVPGMKKALSSRRGRPPKHVTRAKRGKDDLAYDLTVRMRPTMTAEALSEVESSIQAALADVEAIRRNRAGG